MATTQKQRDERRSGLYEEVCKLLIDKKLVTETDGNLDLTEEGLLVTMGLMTFFSAGDLKDPATTPLGLAAKQVGRFARTMLEGAGVI